MKKIILASSLMAVASSFAQSALATGAETQIKALETDVTTIGPAIIGVAVLVAALWIVLAIVKKK
jgi:hypothetical protein